MAREVVVAAPAKVNLFLRVLARADDGYHQLETLYGALDLADTVTVGLREGGVELRVEGADLGAPEENLAHRAARAFLDHVGSGGTEVALEKRIPPRAGLGGGSSDAAAVLRGLNRLHGEALDPGQLVELGGTLGADVPFFLAPTPLALGWGRGDRLLALPPLPSRPVLLVLPEEGIGTADAYARLAEAREGEGATISTGGASAEPSGSAAPLTPEGLSSWEAVAVRAANDFHDTVFRDRPDLAALHGALLELEPELALLSGSGSALFAVFRGDAEARRAREALTDGVRNARLVLTRTLEGWPSVGSPE